MASPMQAPRVLALALGALLMVACNGPSSDATGEEVYVETCARCHGADLGGGVGPALGEGSNAAARDDDYLISVVTDGRGRMPSFRRTLSTEQIERVVGYLRNQQASP